MGKPLCLVMIEGPPWVLAAYHDPNIAHTHSRVITGASVTMIEVLDRLPDSVVDDLNDDFEEGDDTPVTEIPLYDLDDPSPPAGAVRR